METWVVAPVVFLVVLVVGLRNRRRHAGPEDGLEAKAERLHGMVHPDEDAAPSGPHRESH